MSEAAPEEGQCIEVADARVRWHGEAPTDEEVSMLEEVIAAAKRHHERITALP